MKNQRKAFLCFAVLGLFLFCITTVASAQNAEQIAEKALAATVYLEMTDSNNQSLGFGSGFFVGQNQIATNFHVIVGSVRGTAKLVGKHTKYTIESIIATDEKNDLALLEVRMSGIQPLPLGDSDTVKIGQPVYVAGNPEGLEGTFSDGIISSLREEYNQKLIQMTAPVSKGSSGGPVLNRKGKVIGISFAFHDDPYAQNLNFAIPSNYLNALLQQIEMSKPWPQKTARAEIWIRVGHRLHDQKLYRAAIIAYDNAIQLKPDDAWLYYSRGVAKTSLGQYDAAIDDFDKAIHLKPDYASVYYSRGLIKHDLRQYAAAIDDLDKAIHLKPDEAEFYYWRGFAKQQATVAYIKRGDIETLLEQCNAAIDDLDKAIHLKPDYADAYIKRGDIKALLEQYNAAIADYDKAIHLRPNDANAYYGRGLSKVFVEGGQQPNQDLQTALKLAEQSGDERLKAKIEEFLKRVD